MVCIVPFEAEEYVATHAHLRMKRPRFCPHCRTVKRLRALGFYSRYVMTETMSRALLIQVRRFRCFQCRFTVSMLPAFAQPYRLICNATIGKFFSGQTFALDVIRNQFLLQRYSRRFHLWFPKLVALIGQSMGLSPPLIHTDGGWPSIVATFGRIDQATRRLVLRYAVTLFGKYRCHTPRLLS